MRWKWGRAVDPHGWRAIVRVELGLAVVITNTGHNVRVRTFPQAGPWHFADEATLLALRMEGIIAPL